MKKEKVQSERGALFVARIDALLSKRGEVRKALCDSVGITEQAVCNWKKQNSVPSAETLVKISDYFVVDPHWLLYGRFHGFEESQVVLAQSEYERLKKIEAAAKKMNEALGGAI